jgi:hypothetical protein
METFRVPDYDTDGTYLTRLRIVQTPWFGVYLHRFDGPDPRRTLHDHPWPFLSFVLRGGYIERRLNPLTMTVDEAHRVRWVNRMPTHGAHAIVRLLRVPTWTFMVVGRRVRTWGYLDELDEPTSSLDGFPAFLWTEFDKHPHAAEFDAAMARRAARNPVPLVDRPPSSV